MSSETYTKSVLLNRRILAGLNGTDSSNPSISGSRVPLRMIIMRSLIGRMMIEIFVILLWIKDATIGNVRSDFGIMIK